MNKLFNIFLTICFICLLSAAGSAQGKAQPKRQNLNREESAESVFKEIERGIAAGKVSALSGLFNSQMYLNLTNGVNGYYSSNQAYYVLQGFFKNYRVTSFSFGDVQNENGNVNATGVYNYLFKGKRETAQVYVSLKQAGTKWKITQLTIN